MTRLPPRRPRSWNELRQGILGEDHLTLSELERKRSDAASLKHVIWGAPLPLLLLAALALLGDIGLLEVVACLGILAGIVLTYLGGVRNEQACERLIGEKLATSPGPT